jgi:hypothetical protein
MLSNQYVLASPALFLSCLVIGLGYLFGILWEALGLPPLTEENKTLGIISVRLLIILLSILLAWLLLSIYLRQARK